MSLEVKELRHADAPSGALADSPEVRALLDRGEDAGCLELPRSAT